MPDFTLSPFTFEPWQWALLALGAFMVGLAKTGIAGLGMLFVVIFSHLMPAKQATGVVLPLLCFGDVVAVLLYRQHASWTHLWRMFPWTAAGVIVGYVAMERITNREASVLIGAIVIALVALHLWRRRRGAGKPAAGAGAAAPAVPPWVAPVIGVVAGFATLVANAAGPLMAIYLIAMRLPKMEFVGTAAVFFLILNLFKVPFMIELGLINGPSLMLNLKLVAVVFAGALLGRKLLGHINQRLFENFALTASVLAGLKLLL